MTQSNTKKADAYSGSIELTKFNLVDFPGKGKIRLMTRPDGSTSRNIFINMNAEPALTFDEIKQQLKFDFRAWAYNDPNGRNTHLVKQNFSKEEWDAIPQDRRASLPVYGNLMDWATKGQKSAKNGNGYIILTGLVASFINLKDKKKEYTALQIDIDESGLILSEETGRIYLNVSFYQTKIDPTNYRIKQRHANHANMSQDEKNALPTLGWFKEDNATTGAPDASKIQNMAATFAD